MKKIKYLLWLIILGLLGILIYQNLDYFMTTKALRFDLKIASWNWTMPELQNIAYFGICFLLGLILTSAKWFMANLELKKEIKTKNAAIVSLEKQLNASMTELEVFQHDPYIKKEPGEETIVKQPESVQPENGNEKDHKPDTAD